METPLDHFFNDRIDPENFNALTCGPLAVHLKAYAQELYDQGYAVQTAQLQLRMLANFNRWLQSNCLIAEEIDSSTVERYRRFRIKAGKLRTGDTAALARMLRILRPSQVEMPSSMKSQAPKLSAFPMFCSSPRNLNPGLDYFWKLSDNPVFPLSGRSARLGKIGPVRLESVNDIKNS